MFSKRYDGVKVKDLPIIEKAGPYFMPQRIDAVNYFTQSVPCAPLDKWIQETKEKTGETYGYTDVLLAAIVRMLYERPKTNRFVNNCIIYQRKWVSISIVAKKKLTDDGDEDTLKFYFTGRESLPEIKKRFRDEVAKFTTPVATHKTAKTANILNHLPNWAFKTFMWIARKMDKHNCLPKALIDASPFHTSLFLTDLRSIKLDKVYHHIYNFGNTSIFAALGKPKNVPVVDENGEVKVEKRFDIGLSLDERICDGLYYGKSVKLLLKYLENPEPLMERLPEPELTEKEKKQKAKADKKEAKKQQKLQRKEARKNRKKGK